MRGSILRCRGVYPYEDLVDFMVIETIDESHSYSLLVSTGNKAGLLLCRLPLDSVPIDNPGYAVSFQWLISNWEERVYSGCFLNDVYVLEGYNIKNDFSMNKI